MLKHERIMNENPEINSWLKGRSVNTQRQYAEKLMTFCEAMKVTPEGWRQLDKFKARDMAWQYVEPLKNNGEISRAMLTLNALKSWYRNLNGEVLPLDSGRGGKHAIRKLHKKATYEHIPNKEEVYRIVDMAGNLRDQAVLLILFCSGVRVNALLSLTYDMVKDQLNEDVIVLKITRDVDMKLRSAQIPFYYTCINGQAVEVLRRYCELAHKRSKVTTPLFYTKKSGQPISQAWVLAIVKKCVKRAGMNPKEIWTHSLRKSFRKVVRQANIDDDTREMLMGHVIAGSRESYFDRHDIELIKKEYQKCNFAREVPESETTKLRKQLEDSETKRLLQEARLNSLEKQVQNLIGQIQQMTEQK